MKKEYNTKKTNIFVMKKEYKRIFAIIVSFVVVICCFVPVFASSYNVWSISTNSNNPSYIRNNIYGYASSDYVFPYTYNNAINFLLTDINTTMYFHNNANGNDYTFRNAGNGIFSIVSYNGYSFYHVQNDYDGNYFTSSSSNNLIPYISSQSDFNNFCDDVIEYMENQPVENNGDKFVYTLPPGNMIILELANTLGDEISLSTTMPVKSALIGSPWDNSQKQCGLNEIPSDITLPFSGEHDIPWTVVGPYDSVGSSYSAYYHHVNQTGPGLLVTKYWVLINPIYYGTNNTNEVLVYNNGDIYMNVDGVISAKVYSLRSGRVMSIDDPPHIGNETNGTTWSGDIDDQTGNITWTNDQTGDIENPTTGGSNIISTGEDSFKSFLTSIVNKIIGVFQPAHDAIQSLVQAINDFGSVLYGLYSWLPSPVYSIITSAIIVAITIGVVKVFL